jgi:hypothetical protein
MLPARLPFRRVCAAVFIAAYLGAVGWHFVRHVVEGSGGGAAAYFWTWDMYPHYETESVRRTILGETAEGRFVQLLPDALDRFRWGNHGDATRLDLDRRDPNLKRVVEEALRRDRREPEDPERIVRVLVAERYWPVRFNAARRASDLPPSPADEQRSYWRIGAEAEVDEDGSLSWKPGNPAP